MKATCDNAGWRVLAELCVFGSSRFMELESYDLLTRKRHRASMSYLIRARDTMPGPKAEGMLV